jgi:hypothetical protein
MQHPHRELDWSPAIIALCKAFELETVETILLPLRRRSAGLDLRSDVLDKDLGRVAKYCSGRTARPPEMGALCHFLSTAINSMRRRESSVLVITFYKLIASWPRAEWIVEKRGLTAALKHLLTKFRNRAAHIDMMTETEFDKCRSFRREHPEEVILKLFVATRSKL